eukprot:snap_masked-scaffold_2-processed-gene-24.15-mRNA-1 protein AED:1.00 eAED:1.00 QI:0/0/0/0/1/1/4/0/170
MECLSSFTETICGFQGICENNTCVCNKFWERSLDFMYIEDSRYLDLSLDEQPCSQNTILLRILYIFILFSSIVLFIIHIVQIQRKSQLKRLLPLLGTYLIIPKAFFGHDVILTSFASVDVQLRQQELKPWIIGRMGKGKLILKFISLVDLTFYYESKLSFKFILVCFKNI